MKIYYIWSEYTLEETDFSDVEGQKKEKEKVRKADYWIRCKFCLFQEGGQEVLLAFPLHSRHVDVALGYLEMKKLDRKAFRSAGNADANRVVFDSDSCAREFGYDKPSQEGVDKRIEEALHQDGFFLEE